MNIKDILYKMLMNYFVLVTCILAAIMAVGLRFEPDAQLTYRNLAAPLVYALLGILPTAVMYSEKELTTGQLIFRKVIQIVLIEAELMAFMLLNPDIDTSEPSRVIVLMVSILAVYIAVNLIGLARSWFTAQKMTRDLAEFKKMSS